MRIRWILLIALAWLQVGCQTLVSPRPVVPEDRAWKIMPVLWEALPGWKNDHLKHLHETIRRSCGVIANLPSKQWLQGQWSMRAEDLQGPCRALPLASNDTEGLRQWMRRFFYPYRVEHSVSASASGNDPSQGLWTGYFEMEIEGRERPEGRFRTPLYRLPPERHRHHTRAEIDRGALKGKKLEWFYVDPVDSFFLQIQGSGRVLLPGGRSVPVGYAGQNGHPYVAIGKHFKRHQWLGDRPITMQSMMAWLRAHPKQAIKILQTNPSYVYFKPLDPAFSGPLGAQGVPLTPGRSVAMDRRIYPYGLMVWVDTTVTPPGEITRPYQRAMVIQDTGGAIRGPIRGDLFLGRGSKAAALAGAWQSRGAVYVFVPKTVIKPAPSSRFHAKSL